jgi:hypothetical protein
LTKLSVITACERRLEKMGAVTIDNKKYGRVLARLLPRIITTEEEHERLVAEVEKLMDKGERRTAEQDAALDLMVRLIQDYDERNYPLPDRVRLRLGRTGVGPEGIEQWRGFQFSRKPKNGR